MGLVNGSAVAALPGLGGVYYASPEMAADASQYSISSITPANAAEGLFGGSQAGTGAQNVSGGGDYVPNASVAGATSNNVPVAEVEPTPAPAAAAPAPAAKAAAAPAPAAAAKAAAAKAAAAKTAAAKTAAAAKYTVKTGDSLSKIAADHGIKDWHDLYAANPQLPKPYQKNGSAFVLIHPGEVLKIPGKPVAAPKPAPTKPAPAAPAATGGGAAKAATTDPAIADSGLTKAAAGDTASEADLKAQLTDVDKKIGQGQKLLTQFYTQRQYAQSADVIGIVDDSIEKTRQDNVQLEQLRQYIIAKFGKAAPASATATSVPVNESAPVVSAQIQDFETSGLKNVLSVGF